MDKANNWYNFSNPEEAVIGIVEDDFEEGEDSNSIRGLATSEGMLRKSESIYNSVKLHKSKQIRELINSGVFELGK